MRKSSEVWPDIKAKLMSLVITDRDDDCWGWTGGLVKDGYASFSWDGKRHLAHRLSYEVHKGPIPKGKCVCHTCDNPWCCKPDHLWVGTEQENQDDMYRKGRDPLRFGENNPGAVLNEDKVREIKRLLAEGRHKQTEIGAMFRVSKGAIWDIKHGKNWNWVE